MRNIDDICRAGLIGLIMTELLMLQLGPLSRLKFEGDLPELGPMMMSLSSDVFLALLLATLIAMICGVILLGLWAKEAASPTIFSIVIILAAVLLWMPAIMGIVNYSM